MALKVYLHPFASFCQKVLVALYECGAEFEAQVVDLADPAQRAALAKLWPIAKFPVLVDSERGLTLPESTIIIEHLALHHPGNARLVPADPDAALQVRLKDRFYDHYVSEPMQKIVADKLRPPGKDDPFGLEQAKAALRTVYGIIDRDMASRTWATGETFTMADCSAAPSLYYANRVLRIGSEHPHTRAYHRRLLDRPSFARTLEEAKPYDALFPIKEPS